MLPPLSQSRGFCTFKFMNDPFIKKLILKYHARGSTDLEIAFIAGVDISEVRRCLQEYEEQAEAVSKDLPYQGTYNLPNNKAAHDVIFAHQLTLPPHSAPLDPSVSMPKKRPAAAARDKSTTTLKTSPEAATSHNQAPAAAISSARSKKLDQHQELIISLLLQHDYNSTKVYQELQAQGVEIKLRTLQRYCKQLLSTYLVQNIQEPIDVQAHPERMVHCSTLMSSNVVTIPAPIRKLLKLSAQDKVLFIYENGAVTLAKAPKNTKDQ